jgi:hypothetical protein
MAQLSAPPQLPAKRLFRLPRAMARIVLSTVLESISIRPSSRKAVNPVQWPSEYLIALAKTDWEEISAKATSSMALRSLINPAVLAPRTSQR